MRTDTGNWRALSLPVSLVKRTTQRLALEQVGLVTELGQADVTRTFAPPGLWLNPASVVTLARKPETTASAPPSPELAPWHTVVTCREGRHLSEDGRCPSPQNATR
jgi:hypothetical protein